MVPVRAALVIASVLAPVLALAAPPASAKARRLTPADPPPASIPVPEEPKAPIVGSCTVGGNACSDYQGEFAGVDVRALCAKASGTWSASACRAGATVGTCTQRQDGEDRIITRTYAPESADAARKACVNSPRGIFLQSR